MLDIAQLKAGKFKTNIEEFNVLTIVERVIDMQKMEAEKKGIHLHYENLTNETKSSSSFFFSISKNRKNAFSNFSQQQYGCNTMRQLYTLITILLQLIHDFLVHAHFAKKSGRNIGNHQI